MHGSDGSIVAPILRLVVLPELSLAGIEAFDALLSGAPSHATSHAKPAYELAI